MTSPRDVVARRRAQRADRIAQARRFAARLDATLAVRAVVVVGSVARGDFHDTSDIDVVIVADGLPADRTERYRALGQLPAGLEPIAWTADEWALQVRRRNPLACEALQRGVWLVGQRDALGDHA